MRTWNNQIPVYLQLRELIRNKIENGEYHPGMAILSENELARICGINRMTVRNALNALVYEGMLKRVRGKGIFVLGKRIERDLETLKGFTQTMLEKSVSPSRAILVKILRPAGPKYGQLLKIDAKDDIFYIKRICYINNEPSSLEEIFIPKKILPNLGDIDLSVFTLYEIYSFYDIKLQYAKQTLDLATLEQSDARALRVHKNTSLLLFTCISYNDQDKVVEIARTYTRADKSMFVVHFQR